MRCDPPRQALLAGDAGATRGASGALSGYIVISRKRLDMAFGFPCFVPAPKVLIIRRKVAVPASLGALSGTVALETAAALPACGASTDWHWL